MTIRERILARLGSYQLTSIDKRQEENKFDDN